MLIALLWWLQGESDDRARESDSKANQIIVASENYRRELDIYDNSRSIHLDCVDDVAEANKYIIDWHSIFDFLRENGYIEIADQLQSRFDQRNPQQTVEDICVAFPPPVEPTVPPVLIEEGFYTND